MARLLATVRWLKHRGTLLRNTIIAEQSASNHTQAFEDAVDALWTSRLARKTISTSRFAVASAIDVLTSSTFPSNTTQPSSSLHHTTFPSKSDDIRPDKLSKHVHLTPEASEVTHHHAYSSSPYHSRHNQHPPSSFGSVSPSVTDRLAIATRNSVRECLLQLGPVRVLAWRSGIADVCVRVGIDALWAADVSLDSLDPDNAVLRVHAIAVYVANHPDSPASRLHFASPHVKSSHAHTTPSQHAMLRTMANNRINSALNAARAIASPNCPVHPTTIAICALRDMMMEDVCAPLVMSLLRAQARVLNDGPWHSFLDVKGDAPTTARTTPLTIRYWLKNGTSAVVRIFEFQSTNSFDTISRPVTKSEATSDAVGSSALSSSDVRKPVCVNAAHDPPLPTAVELGVPLGSFEFQTNALNVEHLLLFAIRARIRARLKALANVFLSRQGQLRIHPSCILLAHARKRGGAHRATELVPPLEDALLIQAGVGNDPSGIDIRIFSMTGGIRVRPYGAAALSMPMRRDGGLDLWTGAKHFATHSEEMEAVLSIFETVRARIKLNAAARSVCALDIGVSNTLPPGTASVAASASPERAASQLVPPFAPLERRGPRRFLTLSPPPPTRDSLYNAHAGGWSSHWLRTGGSRGQDRASPAKRPRLTYATTSDALVFIQESSFAGEDWHVGERKDTGGNGVVPAYGRSYGNETDSIDRYNGTAAAAAAWAVTREVVERRLRRDSLLRAFVGSNVASSAQMHHMRSSEGGDLHSDSASRVLLKVKCEPLPVRRAELLLRGYDAWQVRLSLLPSIFDNTDCVFSDEKRGYKNDKRNESAGNLWSVGVACSGSQLTFTYPSANTETVRSFFRDLTRARTAAALARGVPPSRFYRVLRKSPVRIVVGIGPYRLISGETNEKSVSKPIYTATVEYVYSKGNSGGFSLTFSPSKHTMEQLAPLIEEALDASGGQVGSILAGLLERACPVAAAAESAVRQRGNGKIRFVTALRVRAQFGGKQKVPAKNEGKGGSGVGGGITQLVNHAVDVDARGGSGLVTVIDVGRATAVMIQQGLAHRMSASTSNSQRRPDFASLPKWDEIVGALTRSGDAEAQRAGSTVVLRMEMLEQFLTDLVVSASVG